MFKKYINYIKNYNDCNPNCYKLIVFEILITKYNNCVIPYYSLKQFRRLKCSKFYNDNNIYIMTIIMTLILCFLIYYFIILVILLIAISIIYSIFIFNIIISEKFAKCLSSLWINIKIDNISLSIIYFVCFVFFLLLCVYINNWKNI